ncbi:uncharacterized protein LOC142784068 isoform X2 [Rhipicephalus microplus]|uniref:uncharacterized protein LOC142784068 isoform X2 n=1 Tax=Rhipicephalus microplus TaxID=6941 RepID=UPI003F6CED25
MCKQRCAWLRSIGARRERRGTPCGSPVAVRGEKANESHESDCTVNSGSGPPFVPSPELGRASSGSTVGAAVDASSCARCCIPCRALRRCRQQPIRTTPRSPA